MVSPFLQPRAPSGDISATDTGEKKVESRSVTIFVATVIGLALSLALLIQCIRWRRKNSCRKRMRQWHRYHMGPKPIPYLKWTQMDTMNQNSREIEECWDRTICAICLEEIQDEELVRKQRCSHVFHSKCADSWYGKTDRTCPLCRTI